MRRSSVENGVSQIHDANMGSDSPVLFRKRISVEDHARPFVTDTVELFDHGFPVVFARGPTQRALVSVALMKDPHYLESRCISY